MNPEEGELRPQLLDRFGLCVEVTGLQNLDARMAVVERRLAFEADPEGFAAGWQGEQQVIRQGILDARERLPRVRFSSDLLRLITAICVDQGVDGHRADIYMLKVAQTLAAYGGREEVSPADVREAAALVLPHRLRRQPFSESEMDETRLEETFRKHVDEMASRRGEPPPPQPGEVSPDGEQAVLVGEVTVAPGATFPVRPLELPPDRQAKKAPGSRTRARSDDTPGGTSAPPWPSPRSRIWPLTPPSGPPPPTRGSGSAATWPWPSGSRTCATRCGRSASGATSCSWWTPPAPWGRTSAWPRPRRRSCRC